MRWRFVDKSCEYINIDQLLPFVRIQNFDKISQNKIWMFKRGSNFSSWDLSNSWKKVLDFDQLEFDQCRSTIKDFQDKLSVGIANVALFQKFLRIQSFLNPNCLRLFDQAINSRARVNLGSFLVLQGNDYTHICIMEKYHPRNVEIEVF